jgi:hypothetical protein
LAKKKAEEATMVAGVVAGELNLMIGAACRAWGKLVAALRHKRKEEAEAEAKALAAAAKKKADEASSKAAALAKKKKADDVANLMLQVAQLNSHNMTLAAQNARLQADNAGLRAQSVDLAAQIEQLASRNTHLAARMTKLEVDNAGLTRQNLKLAAKNAKLLAANTNVVAEAAMNLRTFDAPGRPVAQQSYSEPQHVMRPAITTALRNSALLCAALPTDLPEPDPEVQRKVHLIWSNVSTKNLTEQTKALLQLVPSSMYYWLAQYACLPKHKCQLIRLQRC